MNEQSPRLDGTPCLLGELRHGSEALQGAPEQQDMPRRESDALADFSRHVHGYIGGCIQFADQKAGFLFAFVGAVLAYEFQKKLHLSWLKNPVSWSATDLAAFLSMLSLLVAEILAGFVVLPRLRWTSRSEGGAVYFRSISTHGTSDEYVRKVSSLTDGQLSRALLEHAFDLSEICNAKYLILRWALWIALMGTVSGIFSMLLGP